MAFEHQRLSPPGIHFYIMDLLTSEKQMTMVQLVEKVCLENDIFKLNERASVYHKCRKSVLSLQALKKVRIERIDPTAQGNKKIKITCLVLT
jgi:hypothetical protein